MTEVSRLLRYIFSPKIPPILKLEVRFFSDRKTFAQNDFPGKFFETLVIISLKRGDSRYFGKKFQKLF